VSSVNHNSDDDDDDDDDKVTVYGTVINYHDHSHMRVQPAHVMNAD